MIEFQLPSVQENSEGWGPSFSKVPVEELAKEILPQELSRIPYATFNKSDKVGRFADWSGQVTVGQRAFGHRNYQGLYNTGSSNAMFGFRAGGTAPSTNMNTQATSQNAEAWSSATGGVFYDEDAVSPSGGFQTGFDSGMRSMGNRRMAGSMLRQKFVQKSGKPLPRSNASPNPVGGSSNASLTTSASSAVSTSSSTHKQRQTIPHRYFDVETAPKLREFPVLIRPDWKLIEEFELSKLNKVTFEVDEPVDLMFCGSLLYYDKSYDRVTTKTDKRLQSSELSITRITASQDPILRQFAKENKAQIFATDIVLAGLMAAHRSAYSWDLVLNRVGNQLFIDKRDGCQFDFFTVGETAPNVIFDDRDDINSASSLTLETTYINDSFQQQVLKKDQKHDFANPSPFNIEDGPSASIGYRYRQWRLGEEWSLIARTELDGIVTSHDQDTFITVKALNEYDPKSSGIDYRQKIDSQRGAVFATEARNNSYKLARWICQSVLAGADQIKLGYVSRFNPKDNSRHIILATQSYKPRELAQQIHFDSAHGWGIVRAIIEIVMELPEGRYSLLKDPHKPLLRLYALPKGLDVVSGEFDS